MGSNLVSLEEEDTGTMPCDHKAGWNTVSTSRETQGLPATPQGERGMEQFCTGACEPCQHLDFQTSGLQNCERM